MDRNTEAGKEITYWEEAKKLFQTLTKEQQAFVLQQAAQKEQQAAEENERIANATAADEPLVYRKDAMELIGTYDEVYIQIAKEIGQTVFDMKTELEKRNYILL